MPVQRKASPVDTSLRAALKAVAMVLSAMPGQGMLIGGVAVIARGVPRATRDVDATIDAGALRLPALIEAFERHAIVGRIDDVLAFATAHQVLLLKHAPSGVDVDVSLAWLPFELEAIRAADVLTLGGISVAVGRAEDLVIYKTVAWRPQDQQDIERLLTAHGAQIDLVRVRRIVGEFAAALDEPTRAAELERIISRVFD